MTGWFDPVAGEAYRRRVRSAVMESMGPGSGSRRHPAAVTADRLVRHVQGCSDALTGQERDDFGRVIQVLHEIADGERTCR